MTTLESPRRRGLSAVNSLCRSLESTRTNQTNPSLNIEELGSIVKETQSSVSKGLVRLLTKTTLAVAHGELEPRQKKIAEFKLFGTEVLLNFIRVTLILARTDGPSSLLQVEADLQSISSFSSPIISELSDLFTEKSICLWYRYVGSFGSDPIVAHMPRALSDIVDQASDEKMMAFIDLFLEARRELVAAGHSWAKNIARTSTISALGHRLINLHSFVLKNKDNFRVELRGPPSSIDSALIARVVQVDLFVQMLGCQLDWVILMREYSETEADLIRNALDAITRYAYQAVDGMVLDRENIWSHVSESLHSWRTLVYGVYSRAKRDTEQINHMFAWLRKIDRVQELLNGPSSDDFKVNLADTIDSFFGQTDNALFVRDTAVLINGFLRVKASDPDAFKTIVDAYIVTYSFTTKNCAHFLFSARDRISRIGSDASISLDVLSKVLLLDLKVRFLNLRDKIESMSEFVDEKTLMETRKTFEEILMWQYGIETTLKKLEADPILSKELTRSIFDDIYRYLVEKDMGSSLLMSLRPYKWSFDDGSWSLPLENWVKHVLTLIEQDPLFVGLKNIDIRSVGHKEVQEYIRVTWKKLENFLGMQQSTYGRLALDLPQEFHGIPTDLVLQQASLDFLFLIREYQGKLLKWTHKLPSYRSLLSNMHDMKLRLEGVVGTPVAAVGLSALKRADEANSLTDFRSYLYDMYSNHIRLIEELINTLPLDVSDVQQLDSFIQDAVVLMDSLDPASGGLEGLIDTLTRLLDDHSIPVRKILDKHIKLRR